MAEEVIFAGDDWRKEAQMFHGCQIHPIIMDEAADILREIPENWEVPAVLPSNLAGNPEQRLKDCLESFLRIAKHRANCPICQIKRQNEGCVQEIPRGILSVFAQFTPEQFRAFQQNWKDAINHPERAFLTFDAADQHRAEQATYHHDDYPGVKWEGGRVGRRG